MQNSPHKNVVFLIIASCIFKSNSIVLIEILIPLRCQLVNRIEMRYVRSACFPIAFFTRGATPGYCCFALSGLLLGAVL
jgi:hypothetical protein